MKPFTMLLAKETLELSSTWHSQMPLRFTDVIIRTNKKEILRKVQHHELADEICSSEKATSQCYIIQPMSL